MIHFTSSAVTSARGLSKITPSQSTCWRQSPPQIKRRPVCRVCSLSGVFNTSMRSSSGGSWYVHLAHCALTATFDSPLTGTHWDFCIADDLAFFDPTGPLHASAPRAQHWNYDQLGYSHIYKIRS